MKNFMIAVVTMLFLSTSFNALSNEVVEPTNPLTFKLVAKNIAKTNVSKPDNNVVVAQATLTVGNKSFMASTNLSVNDGLVKHKGTALGAGYEFNDYLNVSQQYNFTVNNKLDQSVTMLFWRTKLGEEEGLSFSGYVQHIAKISKANVANRIMTKVGPNYRYGDLVLNAKVGYKNQGSYTGYYGSSAQASYAINDNMQVIVGGNVYKNEKSNNIYSGVVFEF